MKLSQLMRTGVGFGTVKVYDTYGRFLGEYSRLADRTDYDNSIVTYWEVKGYSLIVYVIEE